MPTTTSTTTGGTSTSSKVTIHVLSFLWCVCIVGSQPTAAPIAPTTAPITPTATPTATPAAPAPTSGPVESPHCCSAFNTVEVKNTGDVSIAQLKIGDIIRTNDNDNQYTQFYGFGHYDHDPEANFIQMTFENDESFATKSGLDVSPDHFVFVKRNNGEQKTTRAIDVMVGDQL